VDIAPNTGTQTQTYTFSFTGQKLLGGTVNVMTSLKVAPSASSTYVALGDSFSSGEGNFNKGWVNYNGSADNSATATDGCDRSSQAYPELVQSWMKTKPALKLPSMQLSFLACSGATTTSIWPNSPAASRGLADGSGNNFNNGESPELNDTAELAHARIVTLSAGGNDVNFSTLIETCLLASYGHTAKGVALAALLSPVLGYSADDLFAAGPQLCSESSPVPSVSKVFSNITTLEPILQSLYMTIRSEAPHAAIYVMGYPDEIPPTPTAAQKKSGCGGLSGSYLPFLSKVGPALNAAVSQAAKAAGISYVDPNTGPFSFVGKVDHSLCNASSTWFYAVHTQGISKTLSAINGSFHPNASGQSAMASTLEASIAANNKPKGSPSLPPTKSVVSDGSSYCALLTSGGVDCWGYGGNGELGNGQYYGSAIPVSVVSTSGSGTLSGVASLTSGGDNGYCALLTSGGVDCWGSGDSGELGNGQYSHSAIPVSVVSTSGSGTLSGVASLTSGSYGYCALLTSGGVDCWGYGGNGELGNGQYYDSAIPVSVVSTSGSGTLSGVASLTSGGYSYCALLTSGGVDCWGYGNSGELGNGQYYDSTIPVSVVSTSGSGTLSGVASLTSDGYSYGSGYCALLTSGGVDCWGSGGSGQLGNGQWSNSAIPVSVVSTSGSGTLSGVASLTSDGYSYGSGYCALLTSGGVDCWGYGNNGELGNGQYYGSASPVSVVSTSGSGTLSGVASLTSGDNGYCALLTSGGVDCWGYGNNGELGNGQYYGSSTNYGSAIPVSVVSTSGSGTLSGVASLTSSNYGVGTYCALLTSGGVDCWGYGGNGELGNGQYYGSAIPVSVW